MNYVTSKITNAVYNTHWVSLNVEKAEYPLGCPVKKGTTKWVGRIDIAVLKRQLRNSDFKYAHLPRQRDAFCIMFAFFIEKITRPPRIPLNTFATLITRI